MNVATEIGESTDRMDRVARLLRMADNIDDGKIDVAVERVQREICNELCNDFDIERTTR